MATLAPIHRAATQRAFLANRISPAMLADLVKLHQNGQLESVLSHVSARVRFKRLVSKSIASALRKNVHAFAVEIGRSATGATPKTFSAEASKYVRSVTGTAKSA